jgi:hypothetical protein
MKTKFGWVFKKKLLQHTQNCKYTCPDYIILIFILCYLEGRFLADCVALSKRAPPNKA